jgi:hypothetical protein
LPAAHEPEDRDAIRAIIRDGLGFNSDTLADDVRVLVALSQRAVLFGLATDFSPDMATRMAVTAEYFRVDHLASILRGPNRTLPIEGTVRVAARE